MAKKTKKPAKPDKAVRPPAPAPPTPVQTAAPTAPATTSTTTIATMPKPARPASARFRRTGLSPAAKRGLDCAKYIRIHLRRPYGDRGIEAIVKIAREAARLALRELDAAQQQN